jgi:hypothetical protein
LVALGRVLRFDPGEAIPDELAGILTEGMVLEDMLDGEFDIEQALASLSGSAANALPRTRLAASVEAEIVRQAATFLGPVAATLTGRYAALTEDPFLVDRALSRHIHVEEERARFLASAPARYWPTADLPRAFGQGPLVIRNGPRQAKALVADDLYNAYGCRLRCKEPQ